MEVEESVAQQYLQDLVVAEGPGGHDGRVLSAVLGVNVHPMVQQEAGSLCKVTADTG